MDAVWFGVLGPVIIRGSDGSDIRLDGPRQAKMLAALLLEANAFVPVSRLVSAMWDEDAPATAVRQVQDAISGLRRHLGSRSDRVVIERRDRLYRLTLEPEQCDLLVFEQRLRQADRSIGPEDRLTALQSALSCWRGSALAGLPGDVLATAAAQLDGRRYSAQTQVLELRLELGQHHEIADEVLTPTREHPLDERLARIRMLALHRSGRRAQALSAYQDLRRSLSGELGVEPGTELQHLHQQILNGDHDEATGTPPTVSPAPPSAPVRGPRQLPADTRAFTGRQSEIDRLVELAGDASNLGGGTISISAIDGMAGVGKTALAVHAARQVAELFPDGQLFVDLQGYDLRAEPVSTVDALAVLLRSLGVPLHGIPASEPERAALLRDRLAGTRTLLVLDNAANAAQVRPLLPGTAGCLVIVTSRRRLPGLDDAIPLDLSVLPIQDAIALLRAVAGPERPATEESLAEIVELCGRIPLAIRITATRLRHHRTLTIGELVRQLRDGHARLAALADDDRSLAAAFQGSYERLDAKSQRLFRLLGVIPGQDFDAYAAANLLQSDYRSAAYLLETLLDHNLLIQHTAGRYRFHDLVRDYARSLSAGESTADREDAEAALIHLLDYYDHTARAVSDVPQEHIVSDRATGTRAPRTAPQPVAREERMAWLRTERDNIVAAISHAASHDQELRAINLTEALAFLFYLDGPWATGVALFRAAVTLAGKRGEAVMEADLLTRLAALLRCQGDYRGAVEVFQKASYLYEAAGELRCHAAQLNSLCFAYVDLADYAAATRYGARALEIFRELKDRNREGVVLRTLGMACAPADPAASIEYFTEALTIAVALGRREQQAQLLTFTAAAESSLGRYRQAISHLKQCLALLTSVDRPQWEAMALRDLGHCRLAAGDLVGAAEAAERSLRGFVDLGDTFGAHHARESIGLVKQAAGQHAEAIELIEPALIAFREAERGESIGEALVALSRSKRSLGDVTASASLCGEALELYERMDHRVGRARALVEAGELAAQTGKHDNALACFAQALEIAVAVGAQPSTAAALDGRADCLRSLGERAAARSFLREAIEIHTRIESGAAPAAVARLASWDLEDLTQRKDA